MDQSWIATSAMLASQDRSELGYLHTQLTNAAQKGLALLEENRAQVAACQALEYERDNYRIELDATRDRVRQVEEEKDKLREGKHRLSEENFRLESMLHSKVASSTPRARTQTTAHTVSGDD
jgi:hypothetical protein